MSNYQTLYFDLSAAQTQTAWFRNLGPMAKHTRAIHGSLVSGDTIVVQFTNEVLNSERDVMSTTVSAASFAPSPTQTATNFEFGYDGNFKWARVIKTGTAGVARVVIEC